MAQITALPLFILLLLSAYSLAQITTTTTSSLPTTVSPQVAAVQANLKKIHSQLSKGAERFTLELYKQFSDALEAGGHRQDMVFSPFGIWSLLLLLVEAADGETLIQLRKGLHLGTDLENFRHIYKTVQASLKLNTTTVEVASMQALFSDINQPPNPEFEKIIDNFYGSMLIPIDFHDPGNAYMVINNEVSKATRGLFKSSVLPQDLYDANLLLISSLYFRGQWTHPFNKSFTRSEAFFDEEGGNIGNVMMMMQEESFQYIGMTELQAHVIELPYGKENRLSMLVVLPKKGVKLNQVVHSLQNFTIQSIFERLEAANVGFEEESVELYMPRFNIQSDWNLNALLYNIGITDIFSSARANLSKMSANVYVKQIVQAVKIIVDEEGTEAASVTSAVLANKATPPKIYLNRPFLYMIVEKQSNVILFAGQVMNPNKFQYTHKN